MAAARKVSAAQRTTRRAFFFQAIGEFADGGGFAGAVDADDEEHARFVGWLAVGLGWAAGGSGENFQDLIFQLAFQCAGFFQFVFVHLLAQRGENFLGGAHAQVGAEQRGFQLLRAARDPRGDRR